MTDYTVLKRLSEAATPGKWAHEQDCLYFYEDGYTKHMMELAEGDDVGYGGQKNNAEFIAAANPSVVLALIAECEGLRKDAARYQWLRRNGQVEAWKYLSTISEDYRDEAIDKAMQKESEFPSGKGAGNAKQS
jgi:hypothetical protein